MENYVNRKEAFRKDLFIALWDVQICVYGYKHSGTVNLNSFNVLTQKVFIILVFILMLLGKVRKFSKSSFLTEIPAGLSWVLLALAFFGASRFGHGIITFTWALWCGRGFYSASSTAAVFYASPLITVSRKSFPFAPPNSASGYFTVRVTFFTWQALL